jgi:catechol 2,3-dioxygenase-like lactoylglutathione lyase family enzyme
MAQLFHVGLTVKNLERSLAFYRDVAEITEEEHLEARSKAFDTLTNNPGACAESGASCCRNFMLQRRVAVLLWTFVTIMLPVRT